MLKLIKLYSEEKYFKEINFSNGINLICGEKSPNSDQQNGVGKTLSIELINFCLLKGASESKVTLIPDEILPKEAFVNLHFQFNGIDYIIARNKDGNIKIKEGSQPFDDFTLGDSKEWLANIFGLSKYDLSARDYINFMIKEEDYSYKEFIEIYKSTYSDLLKVHFYFFGFTLDILKKIKKTFDNYKIAHDYLLEANKDLAKKDLDIEKLRARQNDLKSQIEIFEKDLDYPATINNIKVRGSEIKEKEQELNKLIIERSQLEMQIREIQDFASIFNEDFYIDDNDLALIFNKFKKGLGDVVKKDFDALKEFRNQVIRFKNELFKEKKKDILSAIEKMDSKIYNLETEINNFNKDIVYSDSNNVVKNLRIYRERFSGFEEYNSIIGQYEKSEQKQEVAKSEFSRLVEEISTIRQEALEIEANFKNTFIDVHKAIMKNSKCDFKIKIQNVFKKKSYFKFNIYVEGQGSKGINQIRSVIYDITLLINEFTSKRNLKCIIHDNLIFGSVDKESSINVLNFLHSLDKNSFQYIATINKDDFNYQELNSKFNFNIEDEKLIKIEFTKTSPLFNEWIRS